MKRLVWLFDVDGTLIRSFGAAREAFAEAIRVELGAEDDLADMSFAGRTDPLILGDILARHEQSLDEAGTDRFWDVVRERMGDILRSGRGAVLPGVTALLEAVASEPTWVAALLTGNNADNARLKLEHFGLSRSFVAGTYGEEGANRDDLARLAVERARQMWGVPAERCIVVGDTEHDIQCARAAGARVLAVASGVRGRDVLGARSPDLLLDDLADLEAILTWARGLARG